MLINTIFFLLPFLLYLGIALQGASFYLICIVLPSLFFILNKKEIPSFISKISLCLIALHIIFPITNLINYFFHDNIFPNFKYIIELKWPSILQSNFPSSLFIGSVLILALTHYSKKNVNTKLKANHVEIMPLKYFLSGLFPASIFICLALIYQYNTGIDYHSFKGKILESTELLDNGKYRTNGFYGHPLTVAGVGLAYASFTWSLLWQSIVKKGSLSINFIFFKQKNYLPQISLALITFCNFIIVILSSGRTAGVACVFMLAFVPFILGIRKKPIITTLTVFVVLISSFFIVKKYGLLERIEFTTNSITQSHSLDTGNYRQYFWKVYTQMFIDKPVVGQGNYWLKAGVRENYYNKMGYENLPEKYNAHNNYLEILGSGGLLAAFWILTSLIIIYISLRKKLKEQKKEYSVLPFCFSIMIFSNLVHALTQNVFFDSSVVYIYISLLYVVMWQIAVNEKLKS
ncbi:hypothetical protein GCL60_00550 [Silvanigrella paludirubra]|uniref:O-antigen ligase-related domain-containing protein n=1 Tax=Silvanigrella paludirubra TaxID=2499159 RepID=A0A6N6VXI5_9BACT|nr:O-antigen ligase family protein [Silvanigrella paludirubra]KAB8040437.1 hypothetical protein GCL60_00550 [Silvanigrella paludirubra]